MRIVFDARGIRDGMTGVGCYARSLLTALVPMASDDRFICLVQPGDKTTRTLRDALAHPNVEWLEIPVDPERHPRADFWLHRRVPPLLDELGADVYHGPAYQAPAGRRRPRAASVVTAHDLSVFTLPRAYPLKFRVYLRHAIARSLRAADRVIFVTDYVRREALHLFPDLAPDETCVTPLAARPEFSPEPPDPEMAPPDLPETFFLMVGVLEDRKNPLFMVPLLQALEARLAPRTPALVWSGSRGRGSDRALRALQPFADRGLFYLFDALNPAHLPALYHRTLALVYPSRNEGFGLPLVEAMSCGAPVLSADTTCLPEVVGSGGVVLPLADPAPWADHIALLLEDPALRRNASRRALERARGFSWQRTARETLLAYRAAVETRRGN